MGDNFNDNCNDNCKCKKQARVTEIIDDIKAKTCFEICKYMEAYDDQDLMLEERCKKCVLNLL